MRNLKRIIARLDIKGPNLVKGVQLEGLRVLGNPHKFAQYYYENGADELIYVDTVASLYNRNGLIDLVSKTAKNIFIPLTVGGGVRSIDDIHNLLKAGADRVSINTAAVKRPQFITEASYKFGKSTIVGTIETIKSESGKHFVFIDNGREHTGIEAISWALELESLGVGELLLTSVDRDGTGSGLDIDFIKEVTDKVKIPVIAHGGIGNTEHLIEGLLKTDASAIAIASLLHYNALNEIRYDDETFEGNKNFINNAYKFLSFENTDLISIKKKIIENNILIRSAG